MAGHGGRRTSLKRTLGPGTEPAYAVDVLDRRIRREHTRRALFSPAHSGPGRVLRTRARGRRERRPASRGGDRRRTAGEARRRGSQPALNSPVRAAPRDRRAARLPASTREARWQAPDTAPRRAWMTALWAASTSSSSMPTIRTPARPSRTRGGSRCWPPTIGCAPITSGRARPPYGRRTSGVIPWRGGCGPRRRCTAHRWAPHSCSAQSPWR